jgi:NAD(P)-dependent dehydrogenase (short-subunit alcohol dehydrogenase family)
MFLFGPATGPPRGDVSVVTRPDASDTPDTTGLLAGRVAVVSGIGPGMGRAIACTLAAAGADVALGARRASSLDGVAGDVEALGRRAVPVATDITDPDQCRRLAHTAVAELGRIDVLVNNAFAEEDWHLPFDGFDPGRWRRPVDVNLFGSLELTRATVPHLEAAGGGSVVMITTLSVRNPIPLLAGYAASKRALTTAAQVLARELGPKRIRVNCVAPGHVRGRSLDEYFAWIAEQRGVDPEEVADEIAAMNPLHHVPAPGEIAPAVLFFASGLSRMVTGQTLDVNCGRTMD